MLYKIVLLLLLTFTIVIDQNIQITPEKKNYFPVYIYPLNK